MLDDGVLLLAEPVPVVDDEHVVEPVVVFAGGLEVFLEWSILLVGANNIGDDFMQILII